MYVIRAGRRLSFALRSKPCLSQSHSIYRKPFLDHTDVIAACGLPMAAFQQGGTKPPGSPRGACSHFAAARTIATIPARTASGSSGQAATTAYPENLTRPATRTPLRYYTPTTHLAPEIHAFLAGSCCVICGLANATRFCKMRGRQGFRRRDGRLRDALHAGCRGFESLIAHRSQGSSNLR
jgi:hypothetical protein